MIANSETPKVGQDMTIYGVGCTYEKKDVSDEFVRKGMVCIGWRPDEKLYFHGMFKDIEEGDVIVLKSFIRRPGEQILRIKAIGTVVDTNIRKNDLGHCICVAWLPGYDANGIEDIPLYGDGGIQRATTIYREHNPELCRQIERLMERLRKD